MTTFNVDAEALLEEQTQVIAQLQMQNLILRHQLKDAERQIHALEGSTKEEANPVAKLVRDTKS